MVNQSSRILGGVASARSSDSQSQGPVAMQVQNLEKKKRVPVSYARGCRHQELLQGYPSPEGHVEVAGVFGKKEKAV